jgi:hypothetical protein
MDCVSWLSPWRTLATCLAGRASARRLVVGGAFASPGNFLPLLGLISLDFFKIIGVFADFIGWIRVAFSGRAWSFEHNC